MMNKLTVLVAAIVVAAPSVSVAQAAKPAPTPSAPVTACASLVAAIDATQKEISALYVGNLGEDSAPRATMRASEIAGLYGEVQANIALMAANRCAPYPHPLSRAAFLGDALTCSTARLKAYGQTPKDLPECNRTMWSREH
jgi:hypothetical protein